MTTSIDETEQARADLYRLLGATLSHPPTAPLLEHLSALPTGRDANPLATALGRLARAAQATTLAAARREYDALFVGVARGELVPYASFYLTGFLHDRPLMRLREDLGALGLVTVASHVDPEDHAGTMCELMAGLIDGGHGVQQPLVEQRRFFTRHMAPWLERFFADLETAPTAKFYASVAMLGQAFLAIERLAFQMEAFQ
jgi:TorA maturation chaperone TorD